MWRSCFRPTTRLMHVLKPTSFGANLVELDCDKFAAEKSFHARVVHDLTNTVLANGIKAGNLKSFYLPLFDNEKKAATTEGQEILESAGHLQDYLRTHPAVKCDPTSIWGINWGNAPIDLNESTEVVAEMAMYATSPFNVGVCMRGWNDDKIRKWDDASRAFVDVSETEVGQLKARIFFMAVTMTSDGLAELFQLQQTQCALNCCLQTVGTTLTANDTIAALVFNSSSTREFEQGVSECEDYLKFLRTNKPTDSLLRQGGVPVPLYAIYTSWRNLTPYEHLLKMHNQLDKTKDSSLQELPHGIRFVPGMLRNTK